MKLRVNVVEDKGLDWFFDNASDLDVGALSEHEKNHVTALLREFMGVDKWRISDKDLYSLCATYIATHGKKKFLDMCAREDLGEHIDLELAIAEAKTVYDLVKVRVDWNLAKMYKNAEGRTGRKGPFLGCELNPNWHPKEK